MVCIDINDMQLSSLSGAVCVVYQIALCVVTWLYCSQVQIDPVQPFCTVGAIGSQYLKFGIHQFDRIGLGCNLSHRFSVLM